MTGARARELLGRAAMLGALLHGCAGASDRTVSRPAPPPLPAATATCSAPESLRAHRAAEAEAIAAAKIERYPYAPGEALAALELLSEAASCRAAGGDRRGAERASSRAAGFRARVERDYRDHYVRYQRARAAGRSRAALREIESLLELLGRHGGAFAAALRGEQLALEQADNPSS